MSKILKTKRDWIEYAMKLESTLCLRPVCDNHPDEQWIKNYQEWHWRVVDLWEAYDTRNAQKELAA